ncbi:MAG: hypothetical protein GXP63_05130 [DPANN group archaeon]|nr:hypothetical protein [DPANN group archaeon]
MKKTSMIGIFAVMALSAVLIVGAVNAYRGDYASKGPNYSEERHQAMEAAFDNNDYDAWAALMAEDGRNPHMLEVVNQDNFATFANMHEAMEEGDQDTAAQLRAELGLGNGRGRGHAGMMGRGHRQGMGSHQNFVDADGDGSCDNFGQSMGQGRDR